MSIHPIITFKAGQCDFDEETGKVTPQPGSGYLYLHNDEDLMHFCWRKRSTSLDEPELDLIMFPSDCTFTPYQKGHVNGRIYVLKFTSSSQRQFFWLQSKSQSPSGNASHFSSRDLKIGEVVNSLLQGEDVDVAQAVSEMKAGHPPDDDDATMEDVEGRGGAGAGGAGRDIRDEGEDAREGGADGGRASGGNNDAQSIIQNFLSSIGSSTGAQQSASQGQQKLFTTLQDLLTPSTTITWLDTAPESTLDNLMQYLPPNLASLARDDDEDDVSKSSLSASEKRKLLQKVLRSPQFTQSLASLTFALRDGGLPSISEALGVPVQNGGFMRRGGVPLGGGEAVEVFLNGVKDSVQQDKDDEDDGMDTS